MTDDSGATAMASAAYAIVPPLPAPTGIEHVTQYPGSVQTFWDDVPGVAELPREDSEGAPYTIDAYLVRYRAVGAAEWIYVWQERTADDVWEVFDTGIREFSVAALRHPLEQLTPAALRWSAAHPYAAVAPPQNLVATATHDTVTVRWDKQPHGERGVVVLYSSTGMDLRSFPMATSAGRHSITFGDVPPSTTFDVLVDYDPPYDPDSLAWTEVTTLAAPSDYEPSPSGPQNLRATATQNSITVSWEASRPAAPLSYEVQVFHAGKRDPGRHAAPSRWRNFGHRDRELLADPARHALRSRGLRGWHPRGFCGDLDSHARQARPGRFAHLLRLRRGGRRSARRPPRRPAPTAHPVG